MMGQRFNSSAAVCHEDDEPWQWSRCESDMHTNRSRASDILSTLTLPYCLTIETSFDTLVYCSPQVTLQKLYLPEWHSRADGSALQMEGNHHLHLLRQQRISLIFPIRTLLMCEILAHLRHFPVHDVQICPHSSRVQGRSPILSESHRYLPSSHVIVSWILSTTHVSTQWLLTPSGFKKLMNKAWSMKIWG